MESEPPLSILLNVVHFISLQMSGGVLFSIVMLMFLLVGSALISGSEVAFFSLTRETLTNLNTEGSKVGQRIIYLRSFPKRLLATILIINNLINIGIVVLSAWVIQQILPAEVFLKWGQSINSLSFLNWASPAQWAYSFEFALTIVGVTFLLVLFGEVAPKIYAKLNNISLSKTMAFPLTILFQICSPFSGLLVNWTNRLENRLGSNGSQAGGNKDDIDLAIDLTVSGTKASQEEADILKGIVKFNDVTVKQIMCSRVDVFAVDKAQQDFGELLKQIKNAGFSRIPVYDQDFDNIHGILYVKDMIGYLEKENDFNWQNLIRVNILYVPESKKINDLLKEFQKERMHMAIVVDEYGGSSGIVTLEDVMEEVIGEIKDEFDIEQELDFKKIDDNNYIFEGKTLLNDVCRTIGEDTSTFDDIRGDSDSLAGLMLEIVGRIPKKDRKIIHKHITLTVQSVTKKRISKIKLTLDRS